MALDAFIGIDIGTYGSKGVLLSAQGEILAVAQREHGMDTPRPGWAEQDADAVWWADFCSIAQELSVAAQQAGARIAAVAASAIGPTCLPVDAEGRPLRPSLLYGIDTRAAAQIEQLTAELGADHVLAITGNPLTAQAVGPKILWLRQQEPEVWARTAHILTASSYLTFRLTGRYVVDAYSAAAQAPLFNLEEQRWHAPFVEACCPLEYLPEIIWTTDFAGEVTEQAARETGIPAGTPVTAGTIDAAAEAISAGVTRPGDMMVMYGTTTFFIQVVDYRIDSPLFWGGVYMEPGSYVLTGGMATTGAITQWFRRELARGEGEEAFNHLFAEAESSPPGANGILLLPYFSGERTPFSDPFARGVWAGLSLQTTRGDLFRSTLEATALGVRHHVATMGEAGAPPTRLVAVGGGTRSRLWLQIVSDVCGLPQALPRQRIGASLGDAFLAAVAHGTLPNLEAIHNWIELEPPVEPDPALRPLYDRRFEHYQQLYEGTRSVVHGLQR
jgi:xylulokinase